MANWDHSSYCVKFQFDCTCFQTGEASKNFGVSNNTVSKSPMQTESTNKNIKSTSYILHLRPDITYVYRLTWRCSQTPTFLFHRQLVQRVFACSRFSYDENVPQPGVLLPYSAHAQNQYSCCLEASASGCWVSDSKIQIHAASAKN